jgi:citronellol/citronellal dehydrogenase
MGKLDGKTALITGASRGIGQSIAELFASEGAKVTVAARTLNEGDHMFEGSLARTVKNIKDAGGEAQGVACDISEVSECHRLIEEAKHAFGKVDILVNNAALTYYLTVDNLAENRWAKCFEINVHAPLFLSKALVPDMIKHGGGRIVNISSGSAIGPGRGPYDDVTPRGDTMYGATKAALERMTQGLAKEVASHGNISVTAMSPSVIVATPGTVHHKLVKGYDDPRSENADVMAQGALLLASEPVAKVNGRVCYDQAILSEFGWIESPRGRGVDTPGSGYSQI